MKYRPLNVLPADWDRVKDFCRWAVLTYGPANAKIAAEMLSTVTLFVLWATGEEYAPLDYASIFHPSLMGRYLRSRVSNKNSSAYKSLHSRLFRIASAVAGVDHNRRKRGRYAVPVHEYTAGELADLESWAGAHRSKERRHQAGTVLALMGGAGLWTKEALAVREADILTDDNGYSIRVSGRNARVVPVLSDFARYLDTPDTRSHDARFVLFPDGSNAETRAGSLRLLYRGAHPNPNPQWLRDTWMLRQLRALPASIVMEAAGMPDVTTLRRYLPNASLPYDEWTTALRDPAAYGISMNTTGVGAGAHGDDSRVWAAVMGPLRDHTEPVNAKQGNAPHAEGRRRPRDRDRGKYERRPMTAVNHEQALTDDCTAFPAGTPAAPFRRNASTQLEGGGSAPVEEEASKQRHTGALEANWTPGRTTEKSRYEALPAGAAPMPATQEALTAAAPEDQQEGVASQFEVLRAALLAEARRSNRGGKR